MILFGFVFRVSAAPRKHVSEGIVQVPERGLQRSRVRFLKPLILRITFQCGQLHRAARVGDICVIQLILLLPHGEEEVIDKPDTAEDPGKDFLLHLVWIYTVSECFMDHLDFSPWDSIYWRMTSAVTPPVVRRQKDCDQNISFHREDLI